MQWVLDLNEIEEFGIFDQAEDLDLSDDRGNLYGIRFGPEHRFVSWGPTASRSPSSPTPGLIGTDFR